MGLLDFVKKAGNGIVRGVDNAAYNSLDGGLLGSAIPQQVSTGLLAPTQYDDEGNPLPPQTPQGQQASQPQRWQPTPDQTRNIRSQFLLNIGSALQQNRPLAEGLQNYQQSVVGQLQAGQQAQQAQAKQQAMVSFQQEMQRAGNDPQAQQSVLLKYGQVLGPQLGGYVNLLKEMKPPTDDVVGQPIPAIGPDGKHVLVQRTKSGKSIPVEGYTPPPANIQPAGNGVLYNPETGRTAPHTMNVGGKPQTVILDARNGRYELEDGTPVPAAALVTPYAEPKAVQNHFLPGAGGYVSVPETGTGTATPVTTPDGKPVLPKSAAAPIALNLGASNADGSPNAMIDGIANYSLPLPMPRAGSPASIKAFNDTIAAVKKVNPKFDATVFPSAQKTLNDFTSGREANSVNAINTAAGHLSTLADAATALNGGDITALNKIANAWGLQTGNSALSVYKTIVHRLGPEITRAYVGAGGGEGDRVGAESDFDPSLGANRILSNIGASANLFQSKVGALQNQFEKGAPGRKFDGFISPEAQATFTRFQSGTSAASPPVSVLKEGHDTTFKNGQVWRLTNGVASRVQ